MRMEADLVKDVLNNPRRQVANLLGGTSMAARYNNFGNPEQEAKVRASEDSWQDIKTGILPGHCQLTAENLSRELSAYYRTYLT